MSVVHAFPEAPVYHLLWTIAEEFGGLTAVSLRRATAISEAARREMDILTLSPGLEPRIRQRQLRREGYIGKRVRVRNLWDELGRADDRELIALSGEHCVPHPDDAEASADDFQEQIARYTAGLVDRARVPAEGTGDVELTSEAGEVVQVARYRRDGTLLATDRLDVRETGTKGGRRITLYSRKRKPLAQWKWASQLYHAWVDSIVGSQESAIISDSAFVGGIMSSYANPRATLLQALHSNHRDLDAGAAAGALAPAKMSLLLKADSYDRLVLLTDRQREALLDIGAGSDNLVTIPNPVAGKPGDPTVRRRRGKGMAVARLSGLKRIDHGIRAVASIDSKDAPTLDIYGNGDERARLDALIEDHGARGRIRLHGHDPKAPQYFRRASFSLLTSTAEGHSLTIVESMAAGCIPIAYDIEYGPSDIITDGVDGFLVPAGDVEALAGTITRFLAMDKDDVIRMREAAIARSQDFSAETIVQRWGGVITEAMAEHRIAAGATAPEISARLQSASADGDGVDLTVDLTGAELATPAWAKLAWLGRKKDAYGRSEASAESREGGITVTGHLNVQAMGLGESECADLFVDVRMDGIPLRTRISSTSLSEPVSCGDRELYATKYGNLSVRVRRDSTLPGSPEDAEISAPTSSDDMSET